MESTFIPADAGNRRAKKRKLARLLGESPPRNRRHKRALRVAPVLSSEYRIQEMPDGRAFLVYRPTRRRIPDHERPSRVKRIRP